jgi:microcin C transport system permease protein
LKRFYKLDRPLLAGYAEWLGVWPAPVQQQIVEISAAEGLHDVKLTFQILVNKNGKTRSENFVFPAQLRLKKSAGGALEPDVEPVNSAAAAVDAAIANFAEKHNLAAATAANLRASITTSWRAKIFETPTATTAADAPPAAARSTLKIDISQTRFDGLLQGNLGVSFLRGEPVLDVILAKLPVSVWFGIWSLVLTYAVCVPLGIVKALRHRAPIDNATSVVLFTGYALPGYILAVIFLYLLAFHWHLFPHSGFGDAELLRDPNTPFLTLMRDRVWHTFLPLICLTSGSFALMTMLMKNTLLDNLALDYVRTAVAKGVSFRDAVLLHAFRNSLVPIATGFGNCLAALLMGSFLIEKIFDIDGVGLLSFTSLVGRDYPVFLGLLSCTSLLLLLGNILSDLCVAVADPRIRFGD